MLMVRRVKDVQLSYKTRIYPNPDQEEVLWAISERCRLLYNFALQERQCEWKINRKSISYNYQQNRLPYLKKKYYQYEQVYSKVLQSTLQKLDSSYDSFYKLQKSGDKSARPPGYRGKEHFFTMNYNQSGFKIKDNQIKFTQFYSDDVNLKFDINLSVKLGVVKQVELFEDNKKYYISITHEVRTPEHIDNGFYQAWDLGITKQTAVNTDGKFIEIKNIRPDIYWRIGISRLQSRRDHCKKKDGRKKNCKMSSKNWVRFNNLKRRCEVKCSNQIKDFQHKMAKRIVCNTKSNIILVGDLSVKSMAQSEQSNRSLNKSTQGTGYLSRFTQLLTYKAEKIGKKVIKVDERYTSKKCCKCNKVHSMKLSDRVMICDCGNMIDRDRNSSVNIMMNYLSQNALWTGYQLFADNLRKTGLDINVPVHSQETPSARVG